MFSMSLSTILMPLNQYLFVSYCLVLTIELNCVLLWNLVSIYVTHWVIYLPYPFRGLKVRLTLKFFEWLLDIYLIFTQVSLTPYFGTKYNRFLSQNGLFKHYLFFNLKVLMHLPIKVSLILETEKNMF